ncbi:MAG TPA: Lrp/AsnC family transcriptional regulator [Thermoanaerobaculia bacterium]|nr:Lrp/AsnC family transcriptional regulator [Thermoanaerobaculia bacterium]
MSHTLDPLDERIVGILLRDGRTPAAQIAEEVGLSRPAVADRIDKLERSGVIRGTTAVVEPDAVGRGITAFVSARGASLTPKGWAAFRELMKSDEILEVHTVAGDDCYLIKIRTTSIPSLNELVSKISDPPIALATRTTIVMETYCEKVGGIALGRNVV